MKFPLPSPFETASYEISFTLRHIFPLMTLSRFLRKKTTNLTTYLTYCDRPFFTLLPSYLPPGAFGCTDSGIEGDHIATRFGLPKRDLPGIHGNFEGYHPPAANEIPRKSSLNFWWEILAFGFQPNSLVSLLGGWAPRYGIRG